MMQYQPFSASVELETPLRMHQHTAVGLMLVIKQNTWIQIASAGGERH